MFTLSYCYPLSYQCVLLIIWESPQRWRKFFVVARHPEKSAVMLVRWWNGDCDGTGKGGDSNWLDVSKASILVASSSDKGPSMYFQTTIIYLLPSNYHLTIFYLSSNYNLTIFYVLTIFYLLSNYHLSIIVVSSTYHLCIF